jgi:NDP-sugar pyrophosphorylase family protein
MTANDIEAIILAGGKGTRLKSILDDRSKPMAIVGGKPFIEWILLMLRRQGIKRVVICTGHLSETVESYFNDGRGIGMEITFARDPFPLGTGGAVRNAFDKTSSKQILVLNGDSYLRVNLSYFLKAHLDCNAKASISLMQVEDSSRYGSVNVNKDGKIVAFQEKSPRKQSGLINAGIYLLERDVVEEIPGGKMVSLEREIFPNLICKGLYGALCDGLFIDIGTPESFRKAGDILKAEFKLLSKRDHLL